MISNYKIIILLSFICIASFSAAIITPALPQISHAFALSHGAIEWVVSIFLCGYVLGQLIYGPLANAFGRLKALRYGLVVNIIGILICMFAVELMSYKLLLVGRFISALGAAAGLSCTFILINELLPAQRAKEIMPYANVSFTIGVGAAVTIGGLISQYFHWQYCLVVLLMHGISMLALTFLYKETLKKRVALQPVNIISGYAKAIKSTALLTFSFALGLMASLVYCFSAAAPQFAHSVLQLNPAQYGYWNLLNMVGMFFSGPLGATFAKRYGPKKSLIYGLALAVPCYISLVLLSMSMHPSALWFFTTTMGLNLFLGVVFASATFMASNAIADKASASSIMSFINVGGAMLSVMIMGYLPLSNIVSFATVLTTFFLFVLMLVSLRLFSVLKFAAT